MKIKAWFEIWDKEKRKLLSRSQNHLIENGARWLLSILANDLSGYGYPANADKHIHYGLSNEPIDVEQWHLEAFEGDLGVITTTTMVSDNHIRLELDYTTGIDAIYISELALALSANDPASKTDRANTVLDRAVVSPTQIIPPSTTVTVKYNVFLSLE